MWALTNGSLLSSYRTLLLMVMHLSSSQVFQVVKTRLGDGPIMQLRMKP